MLAQYRRGQPLNRPLLVGSVLLHQHWGLLLLPWLIPRSVPVESPPYSPLGTAPQVYKALRSCRSSSAPFALYSTPHSGIRLGLFSSWVSHIEPLEERPDSSCSSYSSYALRLPNRSRSFPSASSASYFLLLSFSSCNCQEFTSPYLRSCPRRLDRSSLHSAMYSIKKAARARPLN